MVEQSKTPLASLLKSFSQTASATVILIGGLVLVGWMLMSTDISEKKQAEEQLRFASQYARSLIEVSLYPLATISPDGKITDVNLCLINMLGYSRGEFVEKKLWQVGAFKDVEVVTVNQSTTAPDFSVD